MATSASPLASSRRDSVEQDSAWVERQRKYTVQPTIGRVRDEHGQFRIWRVTMGDGTFVDVEDTTGDSRESYARAVIVSDEHATK